MRCDFSKKSYFVDILYSFLPSLISSILIYLTLIEVNHSFIYAIVIFCFVLQLIVNYIYFQLK